MRKPEGVRPISASRIGTYAFCQMKYFFEEYYPHLERADSQVIAARDRGIRMHETFERRNPYRLISLLLLISSFCLLAAGIIWLLH
ncbi:MAG: hypothetical protein QXP70_06600 [Methanomassiliicoccales archaeon]